jgi:hypothetical protein
LTELDVTEAVTACDVPEDDFEVEGRGLRTPRRAGVSAEREDGGRRAARNPAENSDGRRAPRILLGQPTQSSGSSR